MCFQRRPQNLTKSSPSIWHLLHTFKSTVKISPFFMAFLESTNFIRTNLKVSKFQNESMKASFLPKYEQKIVRISALCSEGRNLDKFLFVFFGKDDFINSFWNLLTFSMFFVYLGFCILFFFLSKKWRLKTLCKVVKTEYIQIIHLLFFGIRLPLPKVLTLTILQALRKDTII